MRNPRPDQVMTAPDGSTKYLAVAVDETLATMAPGTVLAVRCPDPTSQVDLAEWCLHGGRPVLNPFVHYLDQTVLIENRAA